MKYLILLLALFSPAAFADNGSSNVSSIFNSGVTASSPNGTANLPISCLSGTGAGKCFAVYGNSNVAAGSNTCYPLRRQNKTTGAFELWQVTTGTVAHCFSGTVQSNIANQKFQFMTGTATFANNATCSSITGVAYQSTESGGYLYSTGSTTDTNVPIPGVIDFSAQSWPGYQQIINNELMLNMMCYETP